ncbi:MAG: VOC family protein [Ktedonobacteraceae bacterium]
MLLKISKLDHAALLVKDVERTRHFYGEVLGLEEIPRPANFKFPGAWFAIGNEQLHIIGESEPGRAARLQPAAYLSGELAVGSCPHTAFEVDDLEEAQQVLRRHGIKIAGGPRPRGDGATQLYVLDPDGYVVEIFSYDQ